MRNLLPIGILFAAVTASASPSITSTTWTGNLVHGSSLTVTGSSFGTKSQAAPILWDTFDGGTNGSNISGNVPTIGTMTWGSDHHTINPVYSNAYAYSGTLSSQMSWTDATTQCDITYGQGHTKTFYLYYKRYMIPGTNPITSSNVKQYYMTTTVNSYASGSGMILVPGGGDEWAYYNNSGWGGSTKYYSPALKFSASTNTWQTWETYLSMNILPATNAGTLQAWKDGVQYLNLSDYYDTDTEQTFNYLSLGNMYQSPGSTAYCYYDDVYMDTTASRVFIAENSDGTGNREIQPATAWADGSLTVTVNRGSFGTSASAYLFVVDSNGVASTGHPITFGGTVTPPASTASGVGGVRMQGVTVQ